MATDPDYLLVLDLETTGTDEHKDPILEIGMLVVDLSLDVLDAWSIPIMPPRWPTMNDFVFDMHTKNGLITDCNETGVTLRSAQQTAQTILGRWGKKHDFMLAGSGVSHFDRRFLKAQMPELEKWFQYPNLDIGVVRRFATLLCGVDVPNLSDDKPHRALDDARIHLQEMRNWRAFMVADPS